MVSVASVSCTGLPRSGKNVWKMKIFPGQGKVSEVWFESGKLAEIGNSQGKVREFQNFVKTEMSVTVFLNNFQNQLHFFCKMIFKFSEFLCIPDCLTRMLYFKFQAVFEEKTEGCANYHTDQNQLLQRNSCMLVG